MSKYFLQFLCFNLKHGLLFLRFPLEKNKTKQNKNRTKQTKYQNEQTKRNKNIKWKKENYKNEILSSSYTWSTLWEAFTTPSSTLLWMFEVSWICSAACRGEKQRKSKPSETEDWKIQFSELLPITCLKLFCAWITLSLTACSQLSENCDAQFLRESQ